MEVLEKFPQEVILLTLRTIANVTEIIVHVIKTIVIVLMESVKLKVIIVIVAQQLQLLQNNPEAFLSFSKIYYDSPDALDCHLCV